MTILDVYSTVAPNDVDQFTMNFREWLADNDTIVIVSVTATPSGLTIGTPSINSLGNVVAVSVTAPSTSSVSEFTINFTVTTQNGIMATRSAIIPYGIC